MVSRLVLALFICTLCILHLNVCLTQAGVSDKSIPFATWLAQLRQDALDEGISSQTLETAFKDIQSPVKRVIKLDRSQPEKKLNLETYIQQRLTPKRIETGRKMLRQHQHLLEQIWQTYGVPPRYIVALWGLETNYGAYTGGFPVIHVLATLAYDERRGAYFRRELLHALHIIDAGHIDAESMRGSWAGAMGQCQFMPSSFLNYAVDGDNDGIIDIWNSVPDILYSAANYLHRAGWSSGYTWGRKVHIAGTIPHDKFGLATRMPLGQWAELGIQTRWNEALPDIDIDASLLRPDGAAGTAYLVYSNFRSILKWNRSILFGIAVGTLADQIVH